MTFTPKLNILRYLRKRIKYPKHNGYILRWGGLDDNGRWGYDKVKAFNLLGRIHYCLKVQFFYGFYVFGIFLPKIPDNLSIYIDECYRAR